MSDSNSVHLAQPTGTGPNADAPYTPGPWRIGRELGVSQSMPRTEILRDVSYVEGATPTTYHLAEVCYPTSMPGTVGALERMANARLIAAAPDLLEVLQDMLDANVHTMPLHSPLSKRARAAIAKALGESA